MPAAAVIPAPLAYTIIVAVKRLVVGLNKYYKKYYYIFLHILYMYQNIIIYYLYNLLYIYNYIFFDYYNMYY